MIGSFISGATSYGDALRMVFKHRLWGYIFFPGLISVLLAVAIFGTAWSVADDIGEWIIAFYPFEWGKAVLEKIAEVFGGLFVVAIGLILFKNLVLVLASPMMSLLSDKVEKIVKGHSSAAAFNLSQVLKDTLRGLRIALRNIIRELFYTILLFIIGLLVPILSPVTSVGIFLVQSFYAGFGNIDFTLERYYRVSGSVKFIRKNRGLALGNGVVFMILLLSVVGFLFALPLGTIAGTTEALKRLPASSVKPAREMV
jgi:CysZ protein